jgi:lysozyme family protein
MKLRKIRILLLWVFLVLPASLAINPFKYNFFIAMNFDTAFHKLLGHEGGYSNHSSDPGGETMWGVTIAVARQHGYTGPMKDLPVATAKDIYKKMYWDAVKAEELPPVLRYATFDAAVNSGVSQAVRWLQRAAGTTADGLIGQQTLKAVNSLAPESVLMRMIGHRLEFMAGLSNWPAFGRGWSRRIASMLRGE